MKTHHIFPYLLFLFFITILIKYIFVSDADIEVYADGRDRFPTGDPLDRLDLSNDKVTIGDARFGDARLLNCYYNKSECKDFSFVIKQQMFYRKRRLDQYCQAMKLYQHNNFQQLPKHAFVYDHEKSLLGCVPLRTGGASWKYWLQQKFSMSDETSTELLNRLRKNAVSMYSPPDIMFILVRHPLQRLWSAYFKLFRKDKISIQSVYDMARAYPEFGRFMFRRIQRRTNDSEKDYIVEFNDLIEFFAENPNIWLNPRFEPQSKQCQFCNYNYTHILRLEYVNDEVNYMLRNAGYHVIKNTPFFNKGHIDYSNEEFIHNLRDVNETALNLVWNRYKADAEAFGYFYDFGSHELRVARDYNKPS